MSGTVEREPFPAFLYVYVDDADATNELALDGLRATRRPFEEAAS
jgi:hypothetical protein